MPSKHIIPKNIFKKFSEDLINTVGQQLQETNILNQKGPQLMHFLLDNLIYYDPKFYIT